MPEVKLQPHNLICTYCSDVCTAGLGLFPFYKEESGSSEGFGNSSGVTQLGNSGARVQDQALAEGCDLNHCTTQPHYTTHRYLLTVPPLPFSSLYGKTRSIKPASRLGQGIKVKATSWVGVGPEGLPFWLCLHSQRDLWFCRKPHKDADIGSWKCLEDPVGLCPRLSSSPIT